MAACVNGAERNDSVCQAVHPTRLLGGRGSPNTPCDTAKLANNEWMSESLVIKRVLYVYRQIYKKNKRQDNNYILSIWTHDTFRGQTCSFITDLPPTTAGTVIAIHGKSLAVEMMSLTSRQKRTDNCVKKCQIWPLHRWTHSRLGSPVQICPGLSPTAVHHTGSPGSGSVSRRLLQVLCSLPMRRLYPPDSCKYQGLSYQGNKDWIHQQIGRVRFYLWTAHIQPK